MISAPLATPSTTDLVAAPELAAFAILDAGLTVLRRALEAHTLYMDDPDDDEAHPDPPMGELLHTARNVLWAADDLRDRMRRYRRAVDRVVGLPPFQVTYPERPDRTALEAR